MSVMIRGQDRTRLKVMGDVEAELAVPADSAGRCWVSFSDGTQRTHARPARPVRLTLRRAILKIEIL